MTLSSAIVSTAHFFATAPAQGFVALSRVRTLDTLYLVDLHPEKMRCSLPALRKYNELRDAIGLPPFPEPDRRRRGDVQAPVPPGGDQHHQGAPPPETPTGKVPYVDRRTSSARLRVGVKVSGGGGADEDQSVPQPAAAGATPRRRPVKRRRPDCDETTDDEDYIPVSFFILINLGREKNVRS